LFSAVYVSIERERTPKVTFAEIWDTSMDVVKTEVAPDLEYIPRYPTTLESHARAYSTGPSSEAFQLHETFEVGLVLF
jgi:hypothetical protein